MNKEVIFVIEPDTGRITVESSQVSAGLAKEVKRSLGRGISVNCGRPGLLFGGEGLSVSSGEGISSRKKDEEGKIYLFRVYHHSTVDGPGRRSVIQVAGCSIRCQGCYVPETHERANGRLVSIEEIVGEVERRREGHDGVTILGGEPFDQAGSVEVLVKELKKRGFHLVIYSGYTLENLLSRNCRSVNGILAGADLLIDGPFEREFSGRAGEYRGSGNQRMFFRPVLRRSMRAFRGKF